MQMKPYKQWAPGYEHCDNEQGWGPQSTIAPPCSTHSPPDINPWDSADACDGKEGAFYLVCKQICQTLDMKIKVLYGKTRLKPILYHRCG